MAFWTCLVLGACLWADSRKRHGRDLFIANVEK
jgi:hypothetical protein